MTDSDVTSVRASGWLTGEESSPGSVCLKRAENPANRPSFVGNEGLIVGMCLAIFLLYGILLGLLVKAFEQRLPRVNPLRPEGSVAGYMIIIGRGALYLPLFVLILFFESVCGREPNYVTGVFLIGLGFATATIWMRQLITDIPPRLITLATAAAYIMLAGATLAGAVRTESDITAILQG
ncbi:MAG: hypothetical protein O3B95_04740 [Chloroflexi bacterium]|nr:hypothetical protein [Chloroflexota bacterium]